MISNFLFCLATKGFPFMLNIFYIAFQNMFYSGLSVNCLSRHWALNHWLVARWICIWGSPVLLSEIHFISFLIIYPSAFVFTPAAFPLVYSFPCLPWSYSMKSWFIPYISLWQTRLLAKFLLAVVIPNQG